MVLPELGGFSPKRKDVGEMVIELEGVLGVLVSQGEVLVEETDWSFFTHEKGEVSFAQDDRGVLRLVSISKQSEGKISVVNFTRDGRGWVKKVFELQSNERVLLDLV